MLLLLLLLLLLLYICVLPSMMSAEVAEREKKRKTQSMIIMRKIDKLIAFSVCSCVHVCAVYARKCASMNWVCTAREI